MYEHIAKWSNSHNAPYITWLIRCINIEILPSHDRVFHIFNNRTTMAERWNKSPRSRNIFITNYILPRFPTANLTRRHTFSTCSCSSSLLVLKPHANFIVDGSSAVQGWQHMEHAKLNVNIGNLKIRSVTRCHYFSCPNDYINISIINRFLRAVNWKRMLHRSFVVKLTRRLSNPMNSYFPCDISLLHCLKF
jgi:hypothetical protein